MQLEFDLSAGSGALYIRLDAGDIFRTVELGDNANVDIAEDGSVIGVEVIDVDLPWPLEQVLDRFKIPQNEVEQLRLYFGAGLGLHAEGQESGQAPAPVLTGGLLSAA